MIAKALTDPYGDRSDSNPHAVAFTFLPDLTTCHPLRCSLSQQKAILIRIKFRSGKGPVVRKQSRFL